MEFLSEELEELLKLCIENQSGYPNILCEEFRKCNNNVDDERLRSKIKALIDTGYLSHISWADNMPYAGRIEQKGLDYFKQREIYVRAKLRQDPYFTSLDEDCETELKKIIDRNAPFVTISGRANDGKIFEHLYASGYIKLGPKGVSYDLGGGFVCSASLTQKGANYFEDKAARIEEILTLGDSALVVNNIGNQFVGSLNGNTITGSAIQIGDGNEQNIDFSDCSQKIAELKNEIESIKLTSEQTDDINILLDRANDACKTKQPTKLKNVLKEIWDFAKATGSGLLVAFLSMKFGFH